MPIATTVAGPGGNYSLSGVPAVTYVRVIQYGYFDVNERVELTADGTRNFNITRDPSTPEPGTGAYAPPPDRNGRRVSRGTKSTAAAPTPAHLPGKCSRWDRV